MIESYRLRSKVISRDRDLYVAIESYQSRSKITQRQKRKLYSSRQSKIFGVPMKNIEMPLQATVVCTAEISSKNFWQPKNLCWRPNFKT